MDEHPGDQLRWNARFVSFVDEARSGSQEALGQLLDACRPYLLLMANEQLPGDLQAKLGASDLVQETLMRGQQGFANFRGRSEGELRRWLRRILLNELTDKTNHYRASGKRSVDCEVPLESVPIPELAKAITSAETPPDERAEQGEEIDRLRQALSRLPENSRQLIQWRNYERLSFVEIGERLQCSPDSARKAWARAIDTLKLSGSRS